MIGKLNSDWSDGDNLISVGAVAERLGLCRENVRLMTKAGKIPSIKTGRRRLYRSGDVRAFVEALK
jgi:excisionase family DNA binding protein